MTDTEIRCALAKDDAEILMKHLDMFGYGEAVMEQYCYELTDYGLISRRDGQPVQVQEDNAPQMTM